MTPKRPKFLLARALTVGALGFSAVLAACEAKMPTAADVDQLDAATAAKAAKDLKIVADTAPRLYIVDGRQVSEQEARGIAASDIEAVEIHKSDLGGRISIRTKKGPPLPPGNESHDRVMIRVDSAKGVVRSDRVKFTGDTVIIRDGSRAAGNQSEGAPIFIIDGVRQANTGLGSIERDDIQSVEVLKGPAAAKYIQDPAAANGVVIIKTKKGGAK